MKKVWSLERLFNRLPTARFPRSSANELVDNPVLVSIYFSLAFRLKSVLLAYNIRVLSFYLTCSKTLSSEWLRVKSR